MKVNTEQEMMMRTSVINPIEAGYQMNSASDEFEKLVDHESDKDISMEMKMEMEIFSRPQSTGLIDSRKEVQPSVTASPAEAQYQNTAVKEAYGRQLLI